MSLKIEKNDEEQKQVEQLDTKEKKEFKSKSLIEKMWEFRRNISVEPIVAGFVIPYVLCRLATQNLNLEKACRVKLDLGDEICDSLIRKNALNVSNYEVDVQKVIFYIEAWKRIIQTAIPTLLIIFMGAWSDRTGNRKICILLPIFGEFMVCLSNIFSTYFFNSVSVEITMFFEGFFPAITGGWLMVLLGVFSYISDITREETRTFRVGLVNLCMTACIPIGTAFSGILLNTLGYYGVFTISGVLYLLTIAYGVMCLKKTSKTIERSLKSKVKSVTLTDMYSLVKETASVAFQKREGNLRQKLILVLLTVAIIYGPNHAENLLTYMYVCYKLEWDALKFSFYSTYSIILHSLSALFSISLFSKKWGFHDSLLCLISVISKLIGSIYLAFVYTDLQMYMVPLVEILNATTFTSLRSMASKLVQSNEMGKMNSLFSLVETMAALVFDPMYSLLNARTITIFPGTIYLFSALLTLPPISLLFWFFISHRLALKKIKIKDQKPNEDINDQ